jgi:hypothetical protein
MRRRAFESCTRLRGVKDKRRIDSDSAGATQQQSVRGDCDSLRLGRWAQLAAANTKHTVRLDALTRLDRKHNHRSVDGVRGDAWVEWV